ncbi:MAG: hypothetical protein GX256_04655 [Fretibacterium sp.]|nr:hypothetical protein [Fretibacterium sp.]
MPHRIVGADEPKQVSFQVQSYNKGKRSSTSGVLVFQSAVPTLEWSDSNNFLPLSSFLLPSQKKGDRLQEVKGPDKGTTGYKCRQPSLGG